MNLPITHIVILRTHHTDRIIFKTRLPSTFPAYGCEAELVMEAAHGHGETYCRTNFPETPLEVRDIRPSRPLSPMEHPGNL